MISFENLILEQPQEIEQPIKPTEQIDTPKVKQVLDDFGVPIVVNKASSPFETKQSANKVLNPNQKSLQGYLKDVQRGKAMQKALTLYRAFKKHCAQNKIDPNIFKGVNK